MHLLFCLYLSYLLSHLISLAKISVPILNKNQANRHSCLCAYMVAYVHAWAQARVCMWLSWVTFRGWFSLTVCTILVPGRSWFSPSVCAMSSRCWTWVIRLDGRCHLIYLSLVFLRYVWHPNLWSGLEKVPWVSGLILNRVRMFQSRDTWIKNFRQKEQR